MTAARGGRRHAFTLAEIAVYCALLLMMLYAIYAVAVSILHYQKVADARTSIQQNGLSALAALTHDLEEARAGFVYRETSWPFALLVPSPRDARGNYQYDSSGAAYWQSYICYFIDTTQSPYVLVRAVRPIATPATAPPPAEPVYGGATFQLPGIDRRVVGRGITSFTAMRSPPGTAFWQVGLTFAEAQFSQDNTFSLQTSICALNN